MTYEVLARKWRPQQFDEVVGQEHVVTTLKNAITNGRVAHAYLFVGPRGVGKTTLARIFARALNCVKGPTTTACGVCDSCREIAAGNNLDVQEIDGASNRKIDDIRELRDNVRFAPTGRFKIYIIDEVHMLTNEAFNALLKTLEEPPAHLKFFMATTDPQKIPGTILSRCQRFDLRRIPIRLMVERLALIAKEEKIDVEHEALLTVARAAEGGLRDAESALDQLMAFQAGKITEADALAVFGMVSHQTLKELVDAILAGNALDAVKIVAHLDEHGKDMQRLLIELLEYFRNLLVSNEAGAAAQLDLTEPQIATLQQQSALTDAPRILRLIEILSETVEQLRYALSRRALTEAALIRCAKLANTVRLDVLLEELTTLRRMLASGKKIALGAAAPSPPPLKSEQAESSVAPANQTPASLPGNAPAEHPPSTNELPLKTKVPGLSALEPDSELERLRRNWSLLMERVGRMSIGARKALLDAAPLTVENDQVLIGIDAEFPDRLEQLKQPRNHNAVLKALETTLERELSVTYELRKTLTPLSTMPLPDTELVEPETRKTHRATETSPPASEAATSQSTMHKWMEDEKVQKVLDIFNGSIQEIRE